MTASTAMRPRFLGVVAALAFVVGGCVRPAGRLLDSTTSPTGAVSSNDGRLTVSVLPYSGEMEQAGLGSNLHHSQQIAIELKVERAADAGESSVLSLRRYDVQLVFVDGARRYALDPLKVYEENRVDMTGAVLMFGLLGGIAAEAADKDQKETLTNLAVGEIRLDDSQPSAGGFLFFDMTGLTQHRAARLVVEYEDETAEVHRIALDVALDGDYETPAPSRTPRSGRTGLSG